MKGIEVRGKCPVEGCNRSFSRTDKKKKPWRDNDFHCIDHPHTTPKHYILKFKHKGEWVCRGTNFAAETLRTYQDACKLKAIAESEIAQKIFSTKKWNTKQRNQYLFEDLIEEWYDIKKAKVERGDLAASYLKGLRSNIENHYSYFNEMDVREIHELETFESRLVLAASTRENICVVLQDFFNWLKNKKQIIRNTPIVPEIHVPKKSIAWVTRDVQENFLTVVNDIDKPIFSWLIYQGPRPSEACALKWDSITTDKENNDTVEYKRTISGLTKDIMIVKENTKTNDGGRFNYIFPETRPTLPTRAFPLNFVFKFNSGAGHYTGPLLNHRFKKYLALYNEKFGNNLKINLYNFTKHSFGCQWIKKHPEHAYALMKHFGHKNMKTMEKYTKLNTVEAWRAIDSISKLGSTKVPQGTLPTRK